MKHCIIFNPLSGNGRGRAQAEELANKIGAVSCTDITAIESYADFFSEHTDEAIVICGGDGTLNRFVNDTDGIDIGAPIFYYASGTGNDFLRDINADANEIVSIDKYIKELPVCTINGKDYKFLNGIGFGIDGYCCEMGDKMRATSDKPVNYTAIAIKGLLFKYKSTNARVTGGGGGGGGKKVWIAPTMLGRFYGGGMMAAPAQNRLGEDHTLSVVIFHRGGRLKTLSIFPSIFKGEHVKHTKNVAVLTGKSITVEFDGPRALQVDGETLLDIKSYSVRAYESKVNAECCEASARA